ncbi:MAG: hypothetical protein LBH21_08580 [Gracilibacteraceae bacterium]|nr:hypothetical protein [Gracilibacteraceae bacterium]
MSYEEKHKDETEFWELFDAARHMIEGKLADKFQGRPADKPFSVTRLNSGEVSPDIVHEWQRRHFIRVLKLMEKYNIALYEPNYIDFGAQKRQASWTITITKRNPRFLTHSGWYEIYIAGLVKKAVNKHRAKQIHELTTGVNLFILNARITDVDVMLVLDGHPVYLEVKAKNYINYSPDEDMESFVHHVGLFSIPPENACFVCMNQTENQLEKMRRKVSEQFKDRFQVCDNNTFSVWIENKVKELAKK